MDFVSDQLFDGRRFRALTLVDNYSRECLEIEVGQNLKGIDVVAVMERIKALRGVVPQRIQCDNGSEFISKALDKWAYDNQVTLDFSRPGKPTDNPFIESFNGSFRDECLNVNWFLSLEDAKEKIQLFKEEYNGFRPHSSLSGLTPNEVVQQHSSGPNYGPPAPVSLNIDVCEAYPAVHRLPLLITPLEVVDAGDYPRIALYPHLHVRGQGRLIHLLPVPDRRELSRLRVELSRHGVNGIEVVREIPLEPSHVTLLVGVAPLHL
jgi:putative transposase